MTPTNLLLVEDDENDVIFMRHAFRSAGITQTLNVVSDGQEAVDYLAGVGSFSNRDEYPLPGLIFTDLKLAKKTGLELVEWVRRQSAYRRIPVIILSASADPKEIEQAYERGANSFLTKPSSNVELIEMLKIFKRYWLNYNQF